MIIMSKNIQKSLARGPDWRSVVAHPSVLPSPGGGKPTGNHGVLPAKSGFLEMLESYRRNCLYMSVWSYPSAEQILGADIWTQQIFSIYAMIPSPATCRPPFSTWRVQSSTLLCTGWLQPVPIQNEACLTSQEKDCLGILSFLIRARLTPLALDHKNP